jgi:argininosuccinate lyase
VPFRAAHHVVGALVARAEVDRIGLDQLDDAAIREALAASDDPEARRLAGDPSTGNAVRAAADIDVALASCDVIGGTAPARVEAALAGARARLDREG